MIIHLANALCPFLLNALSFQDLRYQSRDLRLFLDLRMRLSSLFQGEKRRWWRA
jgi:hypothetical protein